MHAATPTRTLQKARSFKRRLDGIVEQLAELQVDLFRANRRDEAGSLRTVIADLAWQLEEMDDTEDGGEGDA